MLRCSAVAALLVGLTATGCESAGPVSPDPDAATGRWVEAPPLPEGRMRHASAIYRGDLYVAGGIAGPGEFTSSVVRLRASDEAWSEIEPLPFELAGFSLVVLADSLFAVGGEGPSVPDRERFLFVYHEGHGSWQPRANVPDARREAEAVAVDGEIWLTGGTVRYDGFHVDIPGELLLRYRPGEDAWSYGEEIPNPRVDHEALLVEEGRVYLVGGRHATEANRGAQLDVFDPEDGWYTVADSFPTHRTAAAYTHPYVHIVGGAASLDGHRTLDVRDHSWRSQPGLPERLEWPRLEVWEDALWLIGGREISPAGPGELQERVWRLALSDVGVEG